MAALHHSKSNTAATPLPVTGGNLMSRMQRARSTQVRALAEQRERRQEVEDNKTTRSEAVARGEMTADELKPKTPAERLHEARLKEFDRLFEPLMTHMGCGEEDRRLVREAWSTPAEIEATLADWYTKVIVYDIEVGDDLRERSYNHFRSAFMEPAEAARAARRELAEITEPEFSEVAAGEAASAPIATASPKPQPRVRRVVAR